jgi:hypothetical protein
MVLARGASAIQSLTLIGLQRIGVSLNRELGESTVDRGESDRGARPAKT